MIAFGILFKYFSIKSWTLFIETLGNNAGIPELSHGNVFPKALCHIQSCPLYQVYCCTFLGYESHGPHHKALTS